jgi:hypothetical protein
VVITTINPPNSRLKEFVSYGYKVIVCGDKKSDDSAWIDFADSVDYFSYDEQERRFPQLSRLIGPNTYARKNLGYLHALAQGAEILLETDDDTFLRADVGCPVTYLSDFIPFLVSKVDVWNPYGTATEFRQSKIWPRGYPLELLSRESNELIKPWRKNSDVDVIQTLVNREPDLDAIYRLTVSDSILNCVPNLNLYFLERGAFVPGNTQSTIWIASEKSAQWLYFPSTTSNRFADILKMYVAQSNLSIAQASFLTEQFRNRHNYMLDFEEEVIMYKSVSKIIEMLRNNYENSLSGIYQEVITLGVCDPFELEIVTEWNKQIDKIYNN